MTIAVAQSGGPTAAINASLAGIIAQGQKLGAAKIHGARFGIDGVLSNDFVDLTSLTQSDLSLLCKTPATALGSCRRKLGAEHYEQILANLQSRNISAFFYIGGNDSMDTVAKLHDYAVEVNSGIRFVGIPKTIDNDLPETDHTPGFGSAAKYVATTLMEIARDSFVYDLNSVTIIEIMGRDAGWLTAAACVVQKSGGVHLIYLPERPFCLEAFFADIRRLQESGQKQVIVAVSEGL
ncbi:MAG: diphosphate--fructose-6-phosphate 1-phosphotransferase, partial [Oscillospiraceae bacterium]|nr:diphosphate--fructose-6-phosphate 1-phosphotransferase [Oscillospiraceae bacterium]